MSKHIIHARFSRRLVILGFGSIGQAFLPLLFRHFEIHPKQVKIIAADAQAPEIAREFNVEFSQQVLTESNYRSELEPLLTEGDFLLNLSVNVSSIALIELCWSCGALYLDTCIEPWAGGYTNVDKTISQRSNYALREELLAFNRHQQQNQKTALVTQGANPGLVSSFVKQALINLAHDTDVRIEHPVNALDWAALSRRLGVRVIHIAERDTQTTLQRKLRNEFVNTWSVFGFISEGIQPSELGWGSHERYFPDDAQRHGYGCDAAIYLIRPGASTRVRSWTPLEGSYHGFMITHSESISIADHLTLRSNGKVIYRPTVNYAYHPCDDTVLSLHEMAGKNYNPQSGKRIIRDAITDGIDELGVLLMGNEKGTYWFGSRLSIQQARELAPYNNATSMQVVAGVMAGMVWVLRNPDSGLVEPDDVDHELVLEIASPYLGELIGVYSDWTPIRDRVRLFSEKIDNSDPWQFTNFRVE